MRHQPPIEKQLNSDTEFTLMGAKYRLINSRLTTEPNDRERGEI
jgi:hypothetical protein